MKKIISTILLVIMILLIVRFAPMLLKVALNTGITLLKVIIRFWFVWLAVIIYLFMKEDASKKRKKSSDKVEDAEFTVVDEEKKESDKADESEK